MNFAKTSRDAVTPTKGSFGSPGWDLFASEERVIPPGGRIHISTGIAFDFPPNTFGRTETRSSFARDYGITTEGNVVDGDYRGAVFVILFNHGENAFKIQKGMRIAQLVLYNSPSQVTQPLVEVTEKELSTTARGKNCLGSSGLF